MLHQDPKFGYDGLLAPAVEPFAAIEQRFHAGEDAFTQFIGVLTPGLSMYASYVDNFGGWNELVRRFGKSMAFLLSITIFGNVARCADVEPGAMHPSDLPHWLDHVAIRNELSPPWVYTNAANMGAVNAAVGGRKIIRWSAHFGHGPHICGPHTCGFPQADWTQWDNHGAQGQNVDRSVGLWVPTTAKPPVKKPPVKKPAIDYSIYEDKVFDGLNERKTVKAYDDAMKHPLINAAKIKALRADCQTLAEHIAKAVINGDGKVDEFHRKERFDGLTARANGEKIG